MGQGFTAVCRLLVTSELSVILFCIMTGIFILPWR